MVKIRGTIENRFRANHTSVSQFLLSLSVCPSFPSKTSLHKNLQSSPLLNTLWCNRLLSFFIVYSKQNRFQSAILLGSQDENKRGAGRGLGGVVTVLLLPSRVGAQLTHRPDRTSVILMYGNISKCIRYMCKRPSVNIVVAVSSGSWLTSVLICGCISINQLSGLLTCYHPLRISLVLLSAPTVPCVSKHPRAQIVASGLVLTDFMAAIVVRHDSMSQNPSPVLPNQTAVFK